MLWSREEDGGWTTSHLTGLEETVSLPTIGASLKLEDLYEGITFPSAPRLAFG